MKAITINGKEYEIKPIDFNAICELEKCGLSIKDCENQTFSMVRALVAILMGGNQELAGKEIEKHIANGGKFDDFSPLIDNFTESDFFRNLS